MNIRPLEPGCLAIFIRGNPENIGKEVTCIRFWAAGDEGNCHKVDCWEVIAKTKIRGIDAISREIVYTDKVCCHPNEIIRIDGYKETEKEQEREHAPCTDA